MNEKKILRTNHWSYEETEVVAIELIDRSLDLWRPITRSRARFLEYWANREIEERVNK